MRIAILTLTGQRDKCIDNILADKLRKYGHEVTVRSYIYAGMETVCYEKPDVIIHPMVGGQYKYDFVKQCKEWGIEVIVRRGEAGMCREQFDALDDNRRSLTLGNWDYSPYVDLELVWGLGFANIIHKHGHMQGKNLRSCGAFAFDPYFLPEYKKDDTDRKKTILFATGFSTCDCRSNYCELGIAEDSDYHEEIYAIHRAARDTWISSIKKLVLEHGDQWDFELKVRPGEMPDEYIKELGSIVKIHPQMISSSEVLKHVDVLVHSGSTLAIEAHLLNIPSFDFCNVNPDPLLSMVSPLTYTHEGLEFFLKKVETGLSNINYTVFHKLQDYLYGSIDGKACERAADYIDNHLQMNDIKTNIPNTWPKVVRYHDDPENVHLEKQEGDSRWACICCRTVYWATAGGVTRCPYCGMQIHMTVGDRPQGVLK